MDKASKLEKMVSWLRERRVKYMVDYSYLMKYDQIHFSYPEVWDDAIKEAVDKYSIQNAFYHPF